MSRDRATVLRYTLRNQDGTLTDMTCADTIDNRMFVDWVRRHDGHDQVPHDAPRAVESRASVSDPLVAGAAELPVSA